MKQPFKPRDKVISRRDEDHGKMLVVASCQPSKLDKTGWSVRIEGEEYFWDADWFWGLRARNGNEKS